MAIIKLPIPTNTPRPNTVKLGMIRPINPLNETEGYEVLTEKGWEKTK